MLIDFATLRKINFFPFSRSTIQGSSMSPVLKQGQDVLVFTWAYLFSKPKVGDIVVLRKGGRDMVKRIQKTHGRRYFVTGDNEKESTDSRNFGEIDKSEIIGKVVFIA